MTMQILIYIAVPIAMILVAAVIYMRVSAGDASRGRGSTAAPGRVAAMRQESGLRPTIDVGICIGSGGCMKACPVRALGIRGGKAVLASPGICVGHGVCASACPVGAISYLPASPRPTPSEN